MEKEKKPVHKRWWFWVISIIVIVSWIINSADEEQTNEQTQEVNIKQTEQPEQTDEPKEEKEESEQEQSKEKVIELNEEITSVDYTVKLQRVKVKDDILTIVFDWENQSDWDPAHFELLGYAQVEQNGEALEEMSDDRKYKQIKHGTFDVYDLEYKLVDDSDVTIRVVSTNEYDGSEGKVTVAIK